jgi:exopolyphosphatase/guanosine-5'-triphosphate,3'-diphosphate pyrophosphatase
VTIAAGIDIGTNAVKCAIAEVGDGRLTILREMREPTRLGEGVSVSGRLAPAAIERTVRAVCAMAEAARAMGAGTVTAAGTSAARDAANTSELQHALRDACGVAMAVLSGPEEARLSFLGVSAMEGHGERIALFDIGGGSTEWAVGQGTRPDRCGSIPIGAGRLTQDSLTADPPDAMHMREAPRAAGDAVAAAGDVAAARLFATGGTAKAMAAIHARHARLTEWPVARMLTRAEAERQIALFASMTAATRNDIAGMDPGRADIILAGAVIVAACMERAQAEVCTVTNAGVRHGLILDAG